MYPLYKSELEVEKYLKQFKFSTNNENSERRHSISDPYVIKSFNLSSEFDTDTYLNDIWVQFTEEKDKYNWFFDDQLIWKTKASLRDEEQNRRIESKRKSQLDTLRVEIECRSRRISQTIDLPRQYDEKMVQAGGIDNNNNEEEKEEEEKEENEEEKEDYEEEMKIENNEEKEEKKDEENDDDEEEEEEEKKNDIITEDDLEAPLETGFVDESEDYGTEADYKNDLENLGYISDDDNNGDDEEGYGGEILQSEDQNLIDSTYSEERSKSSIINRSAPRLSHVSTVKNSQSDNNDPLNV